MTKLRIGFAGTPDFGIPCLEALLGSKHSLDVIYTQPDRPAGRGRKLMPSAVKLWGQSQGIPVFQPLNFKDPEATATFVAHALDILVVIAYGLILPKRILSAPIYGCINVHASLLPHWRGASPIQHAILHGDAQSGITLMQMDQGMDTGNILTQTAIPIPADFTSRALHDALAFIAPDSLMAVLDNIPYVLENARTQDDTAATYAPKIAKQDARIDWHQSMETIDRQIRAYNPWPVAYTTHADLTLRIHQAHPLSTRSNLPAGTLVRIDNNSLVVSTSTQDLALDVIQFPGKNPVNIADWSKSHKRQVDEGMQFT